MSTQLVSKISMEGPGYRITGQIICGADCGPTVELPTICQCLVMFEMLEGASKEKAAFWGSLIAKQDTDPALLPKNHLLSFS